MKRFLTLLLTLALLIGLLVPVQVQADDAQYPCYVTPAATAYDTSVVKGSSAYIDLMLSPQLLNPALSNVIVCFYRSDSETVMQQSDPTIVETRTYPASDFGSGRVLRLKWTADSRYSVGDYTVGCYVCGKSGYVDPYQSEYLFTVHVVAEPRPAENVYFLTYDRLTGEFSDDFEGVILRGQTITLVPFLMPYDSTNSREFVYEDFNTDILAVAQLHQRGYVDVRGKCVGTTPLTVSYGDFEVTVPIIVDQPGLNIQIGTGSTTLCPGQADSLSPTYTYKSDGTTKALEAANVCPLYVSDNEGVATVDDGVVTAVAPGTTNITVVAGTATATVKYTVRAHELDEDAVTVPNTATQSGYTEGACALCGNEHARNIIAPPVFSDTSPTAWYAPHVDFVYENGIMNGMTAATFAPNKAMTRAMVATVLWRVAGSPAAEGKPPFSDVPGGKWYSDAIAWAANSGIVTGYADGTFLPERNITREQFAVILYRYAKTIGLPTDAGAELEAFPDDADVGNYALDAMRWAVGEGLVNGVATAGVNYLRPKNNTTRAQFATVISRFMDLREAYGEKTSGDWHYCARPDGTVTLTGYLGTDEAPEIPAELGGKPVTAIGEGAFRRSLHLKTLVIPEGITDIGDYAFESSPLLENVRFPGSLRRVGRGAFSGCVKLKTVDCPEGVEELGDGAFYFCRSLGGFSFPASLKTVGDFLFAECTSLSSVEFSEGMSEISERMFWKCMSLRTVSLPDSVTSIGALAFAKCENLSNFAIPAGVNEVGAYAFDGCGSLSNLTFPAKELREYTFRGCYGLESLTLTENVRSIGAHALEGVWCGEALSIPASVTEIAPDAFFTANLPAFEVDSRNPNYTSVDGVLMSRDKSILLSYPAGAMEESYEIPASVTTIGSYAFAGVYMLEELKIPANVTTLQDNAFFLLCNIPDLTVPATVKTMGSGVFERSSAGTINLLAPLKTLPEATFRSCNSEIIVLPDTLETIGNEAFRDAGSLIWLTLPQKLSTIESSALLGTDCELISESPNFKAENRGLTTADGKILLHLRPGIEETDLVIPEGVETIAPYAIDCARLTSVTVPASLKTVGEYGLGYQFYTGEPEPVVGLNIYAPAGSPVRAYASENRIGCFTAEPGQNLTEISLKGNETARFTVENADPADVVYSCFDPEIASVAQDGTITAHKTGKTAVYASVGYTHFKCAVTVTSDGTPNPRAFDASAYRDLSAEEVPAWLENYLKVNEGDLILDPDSNPYSAAYKSENFFEGIWAAQVEESVYDAGAEDLFGVGFRPQMRMMGHGLSTELSCYEQPDSLVLYSGTDDFGRFLGKTATLQNLKESIGTVITEPFFLSTALQESVTPTFGGPYCSVFIIYADRDAIDGGYIEATAGQGAGGEYELLMQGGAKMEIIDAGIREISLTDKWTGIVSTQYETYMKVRLLPEE